MRQLAKGAAPDRARPRYSVVRLTAGQKFVGIILSEFPWGVNTHWIVTKGKGYSIRCTKERGDCQPCETDQNKRWRGYLHVWDVTQGYDCFLELTPGAYDQLCAQAPPEGTLRGLRFEAVRTSGGDQGRLNIRLHDFTVAVKTCPPSKDPEPVLDALWRCKIRD